ncbi:MAG: hypothetical protein ACOH1T_01335 [Microbacteriaceae bacterium]
MPESPEPRSPRIALWAAVQSPAARLLRGALIFASAVALGLLGTGTSYAFLNAAAPAAPTGTLQSGTATLAVSAGAVTLTNLYPGISRNGTFTVSNTGDVPLQLSVTSFTGPTAANGLSASLAPGVCPAGVAAGQVASGNVGSPLAVGATTSVCLTVAMSANAPAAMAGTTTTVTASILGTQP